MKRRRKRRRRKRRRKRRKRMRMRKRHRGKRKGRRRRRGSSRGCCRTLQQDTKHVLELYDFYCAARMNGGVGEYSEHTGNRTSWRELAKLMG